MLTFTMGDTSMEQFSMATTFDEMHREILERFGSFLYSMCALSREERTVHDMTSGVTTRYVFVNGNVDGVSYAISASYTL